MSIRGKAASDKAGGTVNRLPRPWLHDEGRAMQARSLDTRAQIKKVALTQFYEQGFARSSLDQIVRSAGVTKGAFYHHYASKSAVLADVQGDLLESQINRFEAVIEAAGDPAEALRGLIHAIVETVGTERAALLVWSREADNLEAEHRAALLPFRSRLDALFTGVIEEGMRDGVFAPMSHPRIVAFGVVGMCNWAQEWLTLGGPLTTDEVADIFTTLVTTGLTPR